MPVGGAGTHCVLTGHTGMNNAKLFTDLIELKEGDVFFLHVLGQTLAYQVDQIKVVLPDQLDDLKRVPGQDYCTLVTCTPYGINTHRLFVRGHRIDYTPEVQAAAVTEGSEACRRPLDLATDDTIIVSACYEADGCLLLRCYECAGRDGWLHLPPGLRGTELDLRGRARGDAGGSDFRLAKHQILTLRLTSTDGGGQ